jgi:Predicted kinase
LSERKLLVLFIGPPASGKSTVGEIVARLIQNPSNTLFIQSDTIRRMIAKPIYTKRESRAVYTAMRVLCAHFLKRGYSVFVDATFPKRIQREPFKALAKRFDALFFAFWFKCSLDTVLKRNAQRSGWRVVPSDKLIRMYAAFEEEEGLYMVDTERLSAEDAARYILQTINSIKVSQEALGESG